MGALWRPLGLIHFFMCATRALDGAPRNFKNILKQMVWTVLGDPSWGTNLDHVETKRVPMQRGARFVFLQSVPMQRGAHFT